MHKPVVSLRRPRAAGLVELFGLEKQATEKETAYRQPKDTGLKEMGDRTRQGLTQGQV
jgi:hypothetical protein